MGDLIGSVGVTGVGDVRGSRSLDALLQLAERGPGGPRSLNSLSPRRLRGWCAAGEVVVAPGVLHDHVAHFLLHSGTW